MCLDKMKIPPEFIYAAYRGLIFYLLGSISALPAKVNSISGLFHTANFNGDPFVEERSEGGKTVVITIKKSIRGYLPASAAWPIVWPTRC